MLKLLRVCARAGRGRPRGRIDRYGMGRGQAVRRGTLDPVFEGSNPSAPANSGRMGGSSMVMGEPFMATGFGELKVFSGSAHPDLTREIAAFLGVQVGQARLRRFPDTEV